jgi:hypothetical protein
MAAIYPSIRSRQVTAFYLVTVVYTKGGSDQPLPLHQQANIRPSTPLHVRRNYLDVKFVGSMDKILG